MSCIICELSRGLVCPVYWKDSRDMAHGTNLRFGAYAWITRTLADFRNLVNDTIPELEFTREEEKAE
ncbi:unnamed protein product [Dibothriocephalus latus]|uniref:Uncharacterized protein n=1 Tax=Dibothriocephalus latus TaxID=60516 RepID=A0A3P6PXK4_DIBLA|nr:unnamed protein product [Dibothriocephalus latus]